MKSLAQRIAEKAKSGLGKDDTLSIAFVGLQEMGRLNESFVGHAGPTDVICFDYRQSKAAHGSEPQDALSEDELGQVAVDIVICGDVAFSEGLKKSRSYAREMVLYLVHGLLHAAGEDDLSPLPRRRMRRLERKIIAELQNEFIFSDVFIC